jgi:hypothetical protein
MNRRFFILLFLISALTSNLFSQPTAIGLGWSKNTVNGVVFRKNSVVSHQENQYVAYYNSESYVVLAKRKIGSENWQVKQTQYKGNTNDAHCSISIMVDGDGYLHMSWNHHNVKLNYCKSLKPGSLELSEKLAMVGNEEDKVTYPEFHKLPNGDLIFFYRTGSSGRGDLVLNRYHLANKKWERLHNVLIDGEEQRNAYWQACVDKAGAVHLSWVWRETGDIATNHDMCYATSTDFGKTWHKSTGEKYVMPISAASAEYAARIPQKSDLMNQTSMFADTNGHPYIATYFTPKNDITPQYHVIYNNGKGWKTKQITKRKKPFSLSGGGTKKLDLSRPQIVVDENKFQKKVYLIYRDVERDSKVSVSVSLDSELNNWKTFNVTDFSVGDWEPSYDTELWKEKKRLHLYVQKMGQGDGEKLEDLSSQPVYIWEVPIK